MALTASFDDIAPGLMLISVLMLVSHTSAFLAREWELRTLHRYRLARTGPLPLLAGTAVALLVLASLTFGAMLGVAELAGFHNQGSYLDAYVVILLLSCAAVGLGFAVAAFARGRDEAANVSALVAFPLGFLGGAFFTVPALPLLPGSSTNAYDLLPSTQAMDALRGILGEGDGLAAVAGHVLALAAIACILLVSGGLLFWRRRLQRAN